ncbi:hypothetical protein BJF79_07405 [Actinomadura sp. CNU-125]|uniref:single-stranded DNA-binding protein n=1 Tax=Actinomadura sp. CNU-125 TaxID=1904961 RepID=UPI00095F1754|nr:single-stranded DNA-binding protein [Actinomadura sp. CNU-125]OLT34385.1 hypothetical protein BJF79_07405 [Actinomadura sp. CNU-125]
MSTRITIEGILVETPELRFTPSGVAVTTLRILDNPARRVNGRWEKIATTVYEVEVWTRLAEMAVREFENGDLVTVQAYNVIARSWQSKKNPGETGAAIRATADSVAKRFRPRQDAAEEVPATEPEATEPANEPTAKGAAKKTGTRGGATAKARA